MESYKDLIREKDIRGVFDFFNSQLAQFVDEERLILKNIKKANDTDEERDLRFRYAYEWNEFVSSTPFEAIMEYVGNKDDYLSLKDLLYDKTVLKYGSRQLLNVLVEYVVWILSKSQVHYVREYAIWETLLLLQRKFDITDVLEEIRPERVIQQVDKVLEKLRENHLQKPHCSIYMGELFPVQLSNSAKGNVYRRRKLSKFLGEIISITKQKGRYPTRRELKQGIIERCKASGDPRLKIFSSSMSDKTLCSITKNYSNMIARKRRNSKKQVMEKSASKTTNLLEMYNSLTSIEKELFKLKISKNDYEGKQI